MGARIYITWYNQSNNQWEFVYSHWGHDYILNALQNELQADKVAEDLTEEELSRSDPMIFRVKNIDEAIKEVMQILDDGVLEGVYFYDVEVLIETLGSGEYRIAVLHNREHNKLSTFLHIADYLIYDYVHYRDNTAKSMKVDWHNTIKELVKSHDKVNTVFYLNEIYDRRMLIMKIRELLERQKEEEEAMVV